MTKSEVSSAAAHGRNFERNQDLQIEHGDLKAKTARRYFRVRGSRTLRPSSVEANQRTQSADLKFIPQFGLLS